MSLGRLVALAIALVLGSWVISRSGLLTKHPTEEGESRAPIARAREAAKKSADRDAARETAQTAADSAPGGGQVTENMTPDQVRSLLGQPSDIRSETMESGGTREIWTYAAVGKTVVFENGVAVSVR